MNPQDIVRDGREPLQKRKEALEQIRTEMMNPVEHFDPTTFDPDGAAVSPTEYETMRRPREDPPRILPTMGLKPKKLLEGQMIGMYESKQDLYLIIAWLSKRVSDLEDKLE